MKFVQRLSLAQRAFLMTGVPVLGVILASFLGLDWLVRMRASEDLSQGLIRTQLLLKEERMAGEERLRRSLAILTESAGLKAAVSLHREIEQSGGLADPSLQKQIQATLDGQLRDLKQLLQFDLYLLADANGKTLASLPPVQDWKPEAAILTLPGVGRSGVDKNVDVGHYSMVTVPINRGLENLGFVSVGTRLNLRRSGAILLLNDEVLESGVAGVELPLGKPEQFQSRGKTYLASYEQRGQHVIVSLRELDAAIAPALAAQRMVFASTVSLVLVVCLLVSYFGTRSLSKPLVRLTSALAEAGRRGELPRNFPADDSVEEVSQLIQSFQFAAASVRESQYKLSQAYVDFMGVMAEALDARDTYTAGHSRRVADYSVRIARAMQLSEEATEEIRIGGMLHDIGKIGVPDQILNKHEKLSEEEFAQIKLHPLIGRRILERIGPFERFLPAIELHHENHDGTGYPHGLSGERIPLEARIIHVADAYDAMTSDRPYRKRMPEDKVRRILRECAGTQFDPAIIETFLAIRIEVLTAISNDLEKLSHAITVFHKSVFHKPVLDDVLAALPEGKGTGGGSGTASADADFSQRHI